MRAAETRSTACIVAYTTTGGTAKRIARERPLHPVLAICPDDSVARRLGVGNQDGPNAPRSVEGLLDIMADAVQGRDAPLTHERLCAWQAALFPTGCCAEEAR